MKIPGYLILLLMAACAATVEQPPAPERLAVAQRSDEVPPIALESVPEPQVAPLPAPHSRADETRGILELDPSGIARLGGNLAEKGALDRLLEQPPTAASLEALSYLRSPDLRAARDRVEASRTGFTQAADLAQLVQLYRAFATDLRVRVGPERSRRATASIAPSPNVDSLTGEIVRLSVATAFERLRIEVRDLAATARRAHADAVRLTEARAILREDLALQEGLVRVVRARFEAGTSNQAALLAFEARREKVRTGLALLEQTERAVRAEWNRLLHRAPDAPLTLPTSEPEPSPGVAVDVEAHNQEIRVARQTRDRAATAVRLAETMTLPRFDLGSSRFERERASDPHAFPEPGRMMPPRADFGVREAQVQEMRARAAAAEAALDARTDGALAHARGATAGVEKARLTLELFEREILPRREQALESARGAYEGNRSGYLDLQDAAERLLAARLGRADARRDYQYANAELLRATGAREE